MTDTKTETKRSSAKKAPASKPASKPAKAARPRAVEQLLKRIAVDSQTIDKKRDEVEKLQDRNDANVVKARAAGVKFHEIAEASGRSISWVQAAVRRASGTTTVDSPEKQVERAQRRLERLQAAASGNGHGE